MEELESKFSKLSRWAVENSVPSKYLIHREVLQGEKADFDDQKILSPKEFIQENLDKGLTILEVFKALQSLNQDIHKDSFYFFYFEYLKEFESDFTVIKDSILKAYYEIDESASVDFFSDEEDLLMQYGIWRQGLAKELINDEIKVSTMNDIKKNLSAYEESEEIFFSNYKLLRIDFFASIISFADQELLKEDGREIFNSIEISDKVLAVRYNEKQRRSYFKGRKDLLINKENRELLIDEPKFLEANKIFIIFQTKTGEKEKLILDLEKKDIRFSLNIFEYKDLNSWLLEEFEKLKSIFPKLKFSELVKVNNSAELIFWNFNLDWEYFFYMAIIYPDVYSFFHFEEKKKPYSLKTKIDFHFREIFSEYYCPNPSSLVRCNITEKQSLIDEERVTFRNTRRSLKRGEKYYKIHISEAKDEERIRKFIFILSLVLHYFKENSEEIKELFLGSLPKLFKDLEVNVKYKKPLIEKKESKIRRLKNKAPELYFTNYARSCQAKRIPIVINPEEVEIYEKKGYQVMQFPREDKMELFGFREKFWYFICEDENLRYPGLQVNKSKTKLKEFPRIPCCFKSAQIGNPKSKYEKFYSGNESTRTQSEKKIVTSKLLTSDKVGVLPYYIETILKSIYSSNFLRIGVDISENSLIESVLIAIDDEAYKDVKRDKNKLKEYLESIRISLTNLNLSVVAQELPRLSEREIEDWLKDFSRPLEAKYFYRLLEEYFDINIYFFGISNELVDDEENFGVLKLPEFKFFHCRTFRNRKAIILFLNRGTETEVLNYDHNELIASKEDSGDYNFLFESFELHQLLKQSYPVIEMELESGNGLFENKNLYYDFDIVKFAGQGKIVSQYIDAYGKARIFRVKTKIGIIELFTIPSQPLNLPNEKPSREKIRSLKEILSVFPNPSAKQEENGVINGLWYDFEAIKKAVYIPIKAEKDKKLRIDLEVFNRPQYETKETISYLEIFTTLEKTSKMIFTLVSWLYQLYFQENKEKSYKVFAEKYILKVEEENEEDDENFYDFSVLESKLPRLKFQEALEWLSELTRETGNLVLVENNKIVPYNPMHYKSLLYFLKEREYLERSGFSERIEWLHGRFEGHSDFRKDENTLLLLNKNETRNFLRSLYSLFALPKVFKKFNPLFSQSDQPYVYYDKGYHKFYLIQNPSIEEGFSIKNTVYQKIPEYYYPLIVYKNWQDRKENSYYFLGIREFKELYEIYKDYKAEIYVFNERDEIELLETKSDGSTPTKIFKIISYPKMVKKRIETEEDSEMVSNEVNFAALLEL